MKYSYGVASAFLPTGAGIFSLNRSVTLTISDDPGDVASDFDSGRPCTIDFVAFWGYMTLWTLCPFSLSQLIADFSVESLVRSAGACLPVLSFSRKIIRPYPL